MWDACGVAKRGRRATDEEKLRAVRLIESGTGYRDVAKVLGVGESTVLEWWRKYRLEGAEGVVTKPVPGRPSSLTDAQLQDLFVIVKEREPRDLGFEFALWTRELVQRLISDRFGVRMTIQHVGKIMRSLGLSPQRPRYRAHQQDSEKVAAWREEVFPQIRRRAAEEGAAVLFADEAAIRTDHHAGTTWGEVGVTPVVRSTGEKRTLMMISAMSTRGLLRFHLHEGRFTSVDFIAFCKRLLRDLDGKIFLIIDNSSVHTSKAVRAFTQNETDGRLELFFLPPYSPELNPDEWVWNNVKNSQIARRGVQNFSELKRAARTALHRLQKTPGILLGFFDDPHLAYIRN